MRSIRIPPCLDASSLPQSRYPSLTPSLPPHTPSPPSSPSGHLPTQHISDSFHQRSSLHCSALPISLPPRLPIPSSLLAERFTRAATHSSSSSSQYPTPPAPTFSIPLPPSPTSLPPLLPFPSCPPERGEGFTLLPLNQCGSQHPSPWEGLLRGVQSERRALFRTQQLLQPTISRLVSTTQPEGEEESEGDSSSSPLLMRWVG